MFSYLQEAKSGKPRNRKKKRIPPTQDDPNRSQEDPEHEEDEHGEDDIGQDDPEGLPIPGTPTNPQSQPPMPTTPKNTQPLQLPSTPISQSTP